MAEQELPTIKRGPGRPRLADGGQPQKPKTPSIHQDANRAVGDTLIARIKAMQTRMVAMEKTVAPLQGAEVQPASLGPYVGQIVHIKLQEGPGEGQVRAAIITRIIDDNGSVALRIFTDPNFDEHVNSAEPLVRPGRGMGQWHTLEPRDVDREEADMLDGRLEDRLNKESSNG